MADVEDQPVVENPEEGGENDLLISSLLEFCSYTSLLLQIDASFGAKLLVCFINLITRNIGGPMTIALALPLRYTQFQILNPRSSL